MQPVHRPLLPRPLIDRAAAFSARQKRWNSPAWLRLEKSTVSRLVAQLEQQGWLARERSEADKRVLLLSLTSDGRRIASELAQARRVRFERLLSAIPEERREAVTEALTTLVEAIDASL